ncbi:MAG: manganese/zinc/iron transport system permease protein [Saprospiraceae bacterium]|jgi:manganese/zinc/iron transport system permease protein
MFDFWIILTACLVAINSSVLGSFLVLKRMSMLGDALSHSVLPGIVIAFLITQEHSSILTTLFSALLGLLAVFVMDLLSKKGGFQKDAAIGIMYTFLFSIGIILISSLARNADIDVECVLFGDIGNIPFTKGLFVMGIEIPKQTFLLLFFTLVNVAIVFIGIKGFSITTFDPLLASTIGISVIFWNYLLLGLTSLSTVFSFESVGAIMVISMLVIPASFANLLTKKIKPFILIAMVFSVVCSITGYYLAFLLNINIVACISCVMGVLLLLTIFRKKSINPELN